MHRDVKENLIESNPMRTKAQQTFIKRLNELLPHGEATVLAQKTGIHLSTISNWRLGKPPINPTLENLEKLADGLSVPLAYLITDAPLLVVSASERERLERAIRAHAATSDELLRQLESLKKS